ncbi:hypothetical protein [Brevibacillus borstelensis]|uniref:hypothetical protein n=1 Tax=Brevibacillus borstelensis TaxID=45462 RepID=UPI0030C0F9E5
MPLNSNPAPFHSIHKGRLRSVAFATLTNSMGCQLYFLQQTLAYGSGPLVFLFGMMLSAQSHVYFPALTLGTCKTSVRVTFKDSTPKKVDVGLAASYIRNIHAVISKSLRKAKEWGLIKENVTSLVTPPRIEKKQVQTWTLEEINQFLNNQEEENRQQEVLYCVCIGYILRDAKR